MPDLSRALTLIASGITSWLVALSPVGDIAQAFCLATSLGCAVAASQETKRLRWEESVRNAQKAMQQELESVEMELMAQSQIERLEATYSPEVREDLMESLEHLYLTSAAPSSLETSTPTSPELKLAIISLLESGKSRTFVIEEILKMKGRRFDEGKQLLQKILGENDE